MRDAWPRVSQVAAEVHSAGLPGRSHHNRWRLQRRAQAIEDVSNQVQFRAVFCDGEVEFDPVDVFATVADDPGDPDWFVGEWASELDGDDLVDAEMITAKDSEAALANLSSLCIDGMVVVVPDANRHVKAQTRETPHSRFCGNAR